MIVVVPEPDENQEWTRITAEQFLKGDMVMAQVTTQPHDTAYDVPITHWSSAGLLSPSRVWLHKLATLENPLVNRRLGSLQPTDYQQVSAVMRRIYGTW